MSIEAHIQKSLDHVQSEWGAGRPAFLRDITDRWGADVARAFVRHPDVEALARFAPNQQAKRSGSRGLGHVPANGPAPDWVIVAQAWIERSSDAPVWFRRDLRGQALYDAARASMPPLNSADCPNPL